MYIDRGVGDIGSAGVTYHLMYVMYVCVYIYISGGRGETYGNGQHDCTQVGGIGSVGECNGYL